MRFLPALFLVMVLTVITNCMVERKGQYASNEVLTVHKDSVFTIELIAETGRGYEWQMDRQQKNSDAFLIGQAYKDSVTNGDGAVGKQHFTLRAGKRGRYDIRFIYAQPWMKEKSKHFTQKTIKIIIK